MYRVYYSGLLIPSPSSFPMSGFLSRRLETSRALLARAPKSWSTGPGLKSYLAEEAHGLDEDRERESQQRRPNHDTLSGARGDA